MTRERATKPLSTSVNRRLAGYSLSAAASLAAAVPQDASAEIVYTHAHTFAEATYAANAVIPIDLNHDGLADFNLVGVELSDFSTLGPLHTALLYALGASDNRVAVSGTFLFNPLAVALNFGQKVGPPIGFGDPGYTRALMGLIFGSFVSEGNFYNKTNKFLGLKFQLNGKTYYGWARVNVKEVRKDFVFELVDYAYQNTPNVPIRAGEGIPAPDSTPQASLVSPSDKRIPATLGLLAYGSDAIPAWRH